MSDISWASVSRQCLSSSLCASPLWQSLTARFRGSSAKKLYLRCSMTSWYRSTGTSSQRRPADDIPVSLCTNLLYFISLSNQLERLSLYNIYTIYLLMYYYILCVEACRASERRRATDSLMASSAETESSAHVSFNSVLSLYCAPG